MRNTLFILSLTLLTLVGCKQSVPKSSSYSIATLKGPSAMGMIQMIDSLHRTSDTTLKINIYNEPMQVRKEMINGTVDFAILPTTMAAVLYNKGLDYCVVAIPVWGTLYLVGNDSDDKINDWKDLKGKTVHVMAKGMTPDLLFRYLLKENGLQPDKDVLLDYSFPTHINLANAVTAGRAQYGVITEPYASIVEHHNSSIRSILDLSTEWKKVQGAPLAETALLCKKELIISHPEIVKRVIEQYANSTQWVNSNPKPATRLIAQYNILPDTTAILHSIPLTNLQVLDARMCKKDVIRYLQVFYNIDSQTIGGKMPDEKFIY